MMHVENNIAIHGALEAEAQVEGMEIDAPNVPAVAPGAQNAGAPLEEPSYLYTPDGIWFVPHWYLERDKNRPVVVKASAWMEGQIHHNKFTAVNFLQSMIVRAENIVVMTLTDPENPHGRYKRCHWFVRIAVQGGSKMFKEPFGSNFLWQLPYGTCTKIVQEIKAYEVKHQVPSFIGSALARHLRPTAQDLRVEDWRDLQPVATLNGYYDKLFAMSVNPCKYSICRPKDNPRPEIDRFVRPKHLQTQRSSRLNFSQFPDDIVTHIVDTASSQWLASHDPTDWKAVLALRGVSKAVKNTVEAGAERMLKNMLSSVKHALVGGNVNDISHVRNSILNAGLATLPFVLDTNNPKFMNLARLRTNRRPGALPPPPPTREEMSATLKRVLSANQKDCDSDDVCTDQTTEKSKHRLRFERDNAFIRRQNKRRKILMDSRLETESV